jgi:hypothetical protein
MNRLLLTVAMCAALAVPALASISGGDPRPTRVSQGGGAPHPPLGSMLGPGGGAPYPGCNYKWGCPSSGN